MSKANERHERIVMSDDNIIETEEFEKRRIRNMYASLSDKWAAHVERVEADPWPALREAGDEIHRLRKVIEEIGGAIRPAPQWVSNDDPIKPTDICAEAMQRLRDAEKALDSFYS